MTTNKGKLSNPQLVKQLDEVTDSNTVVGFYVQFVLQQKDVKITALENLPVHQKLARKDAQYWRDSVKLKIQQTLTDTIHFSRVFMGKCDSFQLLIDQMKKGNQKAKDEFTTTINTLIGKLDVVVGHTKETVTSVGKFISILDQDMNNFKQDSDEAQRKIIGDSGEKRALQHQLHAINKAIDRDISLTASGGFYFPLGIAGAIHLKKEEHKKHDVERELAKENQEVRALTAVKGQIDGYVKSMPPVLSASTTLEEGWASMKSDFQEVITELKSLSTTDSADYLSPLLQTAKKDWSVVLDRAEQLQPKAFSMSPCF